MVRVNGGGGGTETPFGGVRDSGVGSDGGPEAIEAYQVWKFVAQGAI
jgi:succinate-semialdehyde dehydrogenase/glutarate-semialdehyde dehydrogenase